MVRRSESSKKETNKSPGPNDQNESKWLKWQKLQVSRNSELIQLHVQ